MRIEVGDWVRWRERKCIVLEDLGFDDEIARRVLRIVNRAAGTDRAGGRARKVPADECRFVFRWEGPQ